jgi:hypothetical protein
VRASKTGGRITRQGHLKEKEGGWIQEQAIRLATMQSFQEEVLGNAGIKL